MTRVHYNEPPELTAGVHQGTEWCQACLMFAKGDQVARTRDTWEPLVNDGDDRESKWIEYAERALIRPAVVTGICDMFPGLPLRLCWDHLGAIAPPDKRQLCGWCHGTGRKEGVRPASGPLPPGLANGGKGGRG